MLIRPAGPADLDFVSALAGRVFGYLGDYERIVPEWLCVDGVRAFIADEAGERMGFLMLALYRDDAAPSVWAMDLLAIAVVPETQHRGVGRRLLDHALAAARASRRRRPVRELRLSVAESNERARRMFTAAGFVEVPGEHGRYDGGQRAIQMVRAL